MRVRRHQRSNGDPGYEHRIQAAIKGLEDGTYPNVTQAALAQRVCVLSTVKLD